MTKKRKLGRPPKYDKPPIKTLLTLDETSWEILDSISKKLKISRSDVVQLLIKQFKQVK
jgi:hypothetical protein